MTVGTARTADAALSGQTVRRLREGTLRPPPACSCGGDRILICDPLPQRRGLWRGNNREPCSQHQQLEKNQHGGRDHPGSFHGHRIMHTSICRTTGAPHGLHTAPQTASSWDKIRVFHAPPARDSVLVLGPRPEFQIVTRRPGLRCCCCCGGSGGGASGTAPLTRRCASAILTGGRVNVTLHGPVRVCYRSHGGSAYGGTVRLWQPPRPRRGVGDSLGGRAAARQEEPRGGRRSKARAPN